MADMLLDESIDGFVGCCPEAKNDGQIIATDTCNAGDVELTIKQKYLRWGVIYSKTRRDSQ